MAVERLTPEQAWATLGNGACYLDLRAAVEFEAGHPEGAFNVVWHEEGVSEVVARERFLKVVEAQFTKETPLIVACAAGLASPEAAALLVEAGFVRVYEVPAGYVGRLSPFGEIVEKGWRALGLPIAAGRPTGRSWVDLRARSERHPGASVEEACAS